MVPPLPVRVRCRLPRGRTDPCAAWLPAVPVPRGPSLEQNLHMLIDAVSIYCSMQEKQGAGKPLAGERATTAEDLAAAREGGDEAVDAVLTASRALIAVAVRSLSAVAEDITIAQYRTLVVLASRGPQRLADLAEQLGVTPPTAGRMCDRLARRGLVLRHRSQDDRRVVRISLTAAGRRIVDDATRRRRVFLARIVAAMPDGRRREAAAALRAFAEAAGEVPDEEWPRGAVEAAGGV